MPAAPMIRTCMVSRPLFALQRHPTIDEMRLAGNVACLVTDEEEGEVSDFLGGAEPAHGLTVDEGLAHIVERASRLLRQRRDAVLERRRFDSAGANGVAA